MMLSGKESKNRSTVKGRSERFDKMDGGLACSVDADGDVFYPVLARVNQCMSKRTSIMQIHGAG
jgi:hypothetical protein